MNDLEDIKNRLKTIEEQQAKILKLLETLQNKPDGNYRIDKVEFSTGGGCNIYFPEELKKNIKRDSQIDWDDLR